jgi:isoleucyl-tRNA synthetase
VDYVDPGVWMEKNGASSCACGRRPDYQADIVFSPAILAQLGESYRKIRNTCRYLLSNLYDFVPARDRLEDHELRELDLLALGVLRERDHQVFEAYRRYAFHEVVRLMNDYAITASAEYLDPVKDALYCEAPTSRVRRSVPSALYEMVRTIAPGWRRSCASRRRTWPTSCRGDRRARSTCTAPARERSSCRGARWGTPTGAGSRRSARAARRSCKS